MKHDLPLILGAGIFNSARRFPALRKTAPRTAKTYELEYFFEDGGTAAVNGERHPIRRESLLLAKPEDVRYSHLPFQCKFIHFSVDDPQLRARLDEIPAFFEAEDPRKVDAAIDRVAALFFSAKAFDHIASTAELILLLHEICGYGEREDDAVQKAQKYMEHHYNRELTVQTVAEGCHVSASHLHRLFQKRLGVTPGDFLSNIRISAARDLLVNTDLPVSDIAWSCGFHSLSYFSDCFRKKVGVSPREFRKNAAYKP